jgi:hypothetical protein
MHPRAILCRHATAHLVCKCRPGCCLTVCVRIIARLPRGRRAEIAHINEGANF